MLWNLITPSKNNTRKRLYINALCTFYGKQRQRYRIKNSRFRNISYFFLLCKVCRPFLDNNNKHTTKLESTATAVPTAIGLPCTDCLVSYWRLYGILISYMCKILLVSNVFFILIGRINNLNAIYANYLAIINIRTVALISILFLALPDSDPVLHLSLIHI